MLKMRPNLGLTGVLMLMMRRSRGGLAELLMLMMRPPVGTSTPLGLSRAADVILMRTVSPVLGSFVKFEVLEM